MNKQLTPLEALHNLVEQFAIKKYDLEGNLIYWENILDTMSKNGEYKIVETALKDYKNLKNRAKNLQKLTCEVEKDINKLKALEIIWKKEVHITLLKNSDTLEHYNNGVRCMTTKAKAKKMYLTKEEFDLLKEVLK